MSSCGSEVSIAAHISIYLLLLLSSLSSSSFGGESPPTAILLSMEEEKEKKKFELEFTSKESFAEEAEKLSTSLKTHKPFSLGVDRSRHRQWMFSGFLLEAVGVCLKWSSC